ncbi:MAG: HepT-like ribonuclease domain-containing protein [Candidatus Humimicrobiaceae bacterium]
MKRNRIYIQHILDAVIAIENFITDVSKDKFLKNDMIQSAVIRKIEIIGEATKNLEDAFKSKYNFVPWKNIAGMRDKLIHGYFGVDVESVWEVTQKDLPLLKEQIGKILDDF